MSQLRLKLGGSPLALYIGDTEVIAADRTLKNVTANASIITAGTLDSDRIPGLDAAKITGGVLDSARIPNLTPTKIVGGVFDAAQIPSLPASRITEGTFDSARIAEDSVTQHEAALSLSVDQIDDFPYVPEGVESGYLTVPNGNTVNLVTVLPSIDSGRGGLLVVSVLASGPPGGNAFANALFLVNVGTTNLVSDGGSSTFSAGSGTSNRINIFVDGGVVKCYNNLSSGEAPLRVTLINSSAMS
ncbi:MAG: hypothetical protein M0R75_01495 [Dehalococcoidia bacterium]|nr:hypothetical protein [Dehalococcoidia bacterium]